MGKYLDHKETWKNCTACALSQYRTKIVLAKGKIPCDVLFIGEAPGQSEDLIGKPFEGPAGDLLETIINRRTELGTLRLAYTNLVACIPKDEDGDKLMEPSKESLVACQTRLHEMIVLSRTKHVVCVGKLSMKWLKKMTEKSKQLQKQVTHWYEIIHPAAILRADVSQQGLAIQKTGVILQDVYLNFVPF